MPRTDREALVALYNATDGPHWKRKTNWGSSAPLSEWSGVQFNGEGRVAQLSLNNNSLQGDLQHCVLLPYDVLGLSQEFGDRK